MHAFAHLHGFLGRRSPPLLFAASNRDQPSLESKSSQYNNPEYEIRLEQKGSYMRDYDDIDDDDDDDDDDKGQNMKALCKALLESDQTVPRDSLFREDLFKKTAKRSETGMRQ